MLEQKIQKWMYADGQHNDTEVLITLLDEPPPDAVGCVSGLSRRAEMVGTLFDQLPPDRQDAIWEVVNTLAQQGHKDADCGSHHDLAYKILSAMDLDESSRKGVMDALRAIQEDSTI